MCKYTASLASYWQHSKVLARANKNASILGKLGILMTPCPHQRTSIKNMPIAMCTIAQKNAGFATLSSDWVNWNEVFKSMKDRQSQTRQFFPNAIICQNTTCESSYIWFPSRYCFSLLVKTIPFPGEKTQKCACFRQSYLLWMDSDYAVPVEWLKIGFIVILHDWRGQSLPQGKQL